MAAGYQVVADALIGAGVTDIFGVMGEGNLELITHLQGDRGVAYHAARHEAGAVAAAHGYAQASGRLGVATVTHGPGFTNGLTALVSAARVRAPVLMVVGDTATDADTHVQRTDHAAWTQTSEAIFEEAQSAATIPAVVQRAIHRAMYEWRTVVVLIPVDLLEGEMGLPARPPMNIESSAGPAASPDVQKAIAAIESARRPLVLAGHGAVRADARQPLIDLAETIGAELATTLRARDFFTGHPLNVGTVGGYGHELAKEPSTEADVVLAFGAGLNVFTTNSGRSFADASIIQCDTDRTALGATTEVDVGIVGDARLVAAQLAAAIVEPSAEMIARRAVREERIAAWSPAPMSANGSPLHPAEACRALAAALPADRTVIMDAGGFTEYPMRWLGAPDPAGLVFTAGFGSVGLGLGAGIGATLGRPDRLGVVVVGDGGFMMSLPQFETAARIGLSMVVVVLDDGAYGAEIHHLRKRGRPLDAAQFTTPDLVAVARALGGDGIRVDALSDVDLVASRVEAGLDRPLLVHVPIDGEIISPWFKGIVEHGARFLKG